MKTVINTHKQSDNYKLYIPMNLNLNKLLEIKYLKESLEDKNLKRVSRIRKRKLLVVITIIGIKALRREEREFVHISRDYFEDLIGEHFVSSTIKILLDLKIIERKNQYFPNISPKSYRISKRYDGKQEWRTITDSILAEKIRKFKEEKNAKLNFAQKIVQDNLSHVEVPDWCSHLIDKENPKMDSQYKWVRSLLDQKESEMFPCYHSGRLYHAIAFMKKTIRPFATIDGEEVAEVDIKSAQPFFLLTLYDNDCEELKKYKRALNDDIYTVLNEKLMNPYPDRDSAKKPLMKEVLFPRTQIKKPLWVVFEREFPVLADAILSFKFDHPRGWWKSGKRFSYHLQEIEANAVVYTAIPRLHEMGIIGIPIHDAIMCKRSDCETVRKVMAQSVEDTIGYCPVIEISPKNNKDKEAALAEFAAKQED